MDLTVKLPIWQKEKFWGVESEYYLPPIKFSQPEALAVFLAVRLLESLPSNIREIVSGYLEQWIRDGRVTWNKTSFGLSIPWKGRSISLLEIYPAQAGIISKACS